jgi:hypothetical protein
MLFSHLHKLGDVKGEDWFDPILSLDTKLFIDPFLIYDNERDEFSGSHKEIIDFFSFAFEMIARSRGSRTSSSWQSGEALLRFPEVEELCLGYTGQGTGGLGSGRDIAKTIATALWQAISQGVADLKHFEEVQLFGMGIGPDRISDATAGILRHRLAAFTERICSRYKIPTETIRYQRGVFSRQEERWISKEFLLPINQYNKKPILLVPKRYLRPLPTINPDEFWNYCYDNDLDLLRRMFGEDISRQVDKKSIIELAQKHPQLRKDYVAQLEDEGAQPYDLADDPRGVYIWYEATKDWVDNNPRAFSFKTQTEFDQFITKLISEFRTFVEDNGGWSLLWNENETPKSEEAAQLLFHGIVKHYCVANNVDVSPEANIGRGPVDFKISSGHKFRSLVEVKLAKNSKFWRGLEKQLPMYLKAESMTHGRFLVVAYNDSDIRRISNIRARANAANAANDCNIIPETIDARRSPLSASKL